MIQARFLPESPYLISLPRPDLSLESTGKGFSFGDVARLAIALREGDHAAFRFLHQEWNHRIVRYCFALSAGDDTFAMEIAQATYLRIFKQIRPLRDEAALWNWIACAARSAAIDLRRVNGRYRSALHRFADWIRFGLGRAPTTTSESDLLRALDRGLVALSDDDRSLLESRYFQRVPLESIARTSGLSVRAVEGRLARTRQRLRVIIAATLRENEG